VSCRNTNRRVGWIPHRRGAALRSTVRHRRLRVFREAFGGAGREKPESLGGLAVKHNMATAFHSAQTGADITAASAQSRITSQHPATLFKFANVTNGPVFAPRPKRIGADPQQVSFGTSRETRERPGLARRFREVERLADTRKHVALGYTTGVTLIDGCSQRGKFRLVLQLLALLRFAVPRPQPRWRFRSGRSSPASERSGPVRRLD
jgi:hypothetical protein